VKNKLEDLVNHMFAQIERLGDESLTDPEAIRAEIARAGAMTNVGRAIIDAGKLALDASRTLHELGPAARAIPMLGLDNRRHDA
jgi:hypothetical protein